MKFWKQFKSDLRSRHFWHGAGTACGNILLACLIAAVLWACIMGIGFYFFPKTH